MSDERLGKIVGTTVWIGTNGTESVAHTVVGHCQQCGESCEVCYLLPVPEESRDDMRFAMLCGKCFRVARQQPHADDQEPA
jgi:hypothetical protein